MPKVDRDFMRREAGAAAAFRRSKPVYWIVLALALLAGTPSAPASPISTPTVGPWQTFPETTGAVAPGDVLFPVVPIDLSDPERRAFDDTSDEGGPDGFCGHGFQIDFSALAIRVCPPNRAHDGRHAAIDLIPDNTGPPLL